MLHAPLEPQYKVPPRKLEGIFDQSNSFHFFPLWKRGMKGDLTAFQKAKLLPNPQFRRPARSRK